MTTRLLILVFALACPLAAQTPPVNVTLSSDYITLAWDANTNTGDPVTDTTGYKLHWGKAPRTYTDHVDVGNVTTYRLAIQAPGLYYFAATAYNATTESTYSNEVTFALLPPVLPTGPPGPQGEPGPTGATGAAGAGYRVASSKSAMSSATLGVKNFPVSSTGYAYVIGNVARAVCNTNPAIWVEGPVVRYDSGTLNIDAVRAGGSAGCGDWKIGLASGEPGPPGPPGGTPTTGITSLMLTTIGSSYVSVAWTTDKECSGLVYWGLTSNPTTVVKANNLGTIDHFCQITGLASRTHYYYKVASVCEGTTIESPVRSFNTK